MTARKSNTTATKTNNVSSEAVILDAEKSIGQRLKEMIDHECDRFGFTTPGWKRTLLAYLASFFYGFGIGSIFCIVMDVLFAAIMISTGSAFLAWLVYAIGFCAMLYTAAKGGQKIAGYIIYGDIDADLAAAKAKVVGWFSKKPALASA